MFGAKTFSSLKRGRPPPPTPTRTQPASPCLGRTWPPLSSVHAHLLSLETIPRKADPCLQAHQLETPLYSSLLQKTGAQLVGSRLPLALGPDPPQGLLGGKPCTQPIQASWGWGL